MPTSFFEIHFAFALASIWAICSFESPLKKVHYVALISFTLCLTCTAPVAYLALFESKRLEAAQSVMDSLAIWPHVFLILGIGCFIFAKHKRIAMICLLIYVMGAPIVALTIYKAIIDKYGAEIRANQNKIEQSGSPKPLPPSAP